MRTNCPRLLPESGTAGTLTASFLKREVGSRMVSVLDSGAERPGFKSQPRRCRVTVFDNIRASSHPSCLCSPIRKKLVAALLRVAGVTAGLAESNGSLPPGLWLTSPAGWLPRTGISSRTLRSVFEYELPFKVQRRNNCATRPHAVAEWQKPLVHRSCRSDWSKARGGGEPGEHETRPSWLITRDGEFETGREERA